MSNYIKTLPKDAQQVKNALNWVSPDGKLYGQETRKNKNYGKYFQYATTINKHNGYVYAPIKYIMNDNSYQLRQRRLHIVIAETLIPNPLNLPIVGHKNNIKTQNDIENLYWTTYKENTQKAFDDGLIVNNKGYQDSQSLPVVMFDTYTNKEIGRYGSATQAAKQTKITLNTILRQCKYKKPVRKPFYFRFQSDPMITPPPVVVQYDYETNKEIGRYYNIAEATRQTGIKESVISYQCNMRKKPSYRSKSNTYFLFLDKQ